MSNNAPDYENNLAFDPDINTMPRCDIEDLKKQLETANFYRNQNAEYIQRIEEENKSLIKEYQAKQIDIANLFNENEQLRQLLKECKEFFEEENPKDFTVISERMDDLLTKIDEVIK